MLRAISVDADREYRDMIARAALGSNIEMRVFRDSIEAIRYIEKNDFDLAFVNFIMPVLNGIVTKICA